MRLHGLLGGGDGGKYVFMCKACGKLGGSGGMLPREISMQFVESGTVFAQTFIVSLKPLYYLITCKIEFSAYPREGKCPPPPPPPP